VTVFPRTLSGLGAPTPDDSDNAGTRQDTPRGEFQVDVQRPKRSRATPSGAQSSILHELRDDDWAGKLRSAIFARHEVVDDVIRVLAARAASAGQISEVLEAWSEAIERRPAAAILIGQALPHLFAAVASTPSLRATIIKLLGQSLLRAHALDAKEPGKPSTEVTRLTHALLATDMAVPSAHGAIVEIVRAHRAVIATDKATWPFLAPLV